MLINLIQQSDGQQYIATLKPKYNSIDLIEVELPEIDSVNEKQYENTNMLMDVSGV